MRLLVFAIGFVIALINYINLDVYSVIVSRTKLEPVLLTQYSGYTGNDVFIALGFALVYCVIGGMFSMIGAHMYIFFCKSFGINNKLYRLLKPCKKDD